MGDGRQTTRVQPGSTALRREIGSLSLSLSGESAIERNEEEPVWLCTRPPLAICCCCCYYCCCCCCCCFFDLDRPVTAAANRRQWGQSAAVAVKNGRRIPSTGCEAPVCSFYLFSFSFLFFVFVLFFGRFAFVCRRRVAAGLRNSTAPSGSA